MPSQWYKRKKQKLELTPFVPRNCWKKYAAGKVSYFKYPLTPEGYEQAVAEWRRTAAAEDSMLREHLQTTIDIHEAAMNHGGNVEIGLGVVIGQRQARKRAKPAGNALASFLARKEAEAKAGKITYARWEALRCHLDHFDQWKERPAIEDINESTVSAFYLHLLAKKAANDFGPKTAHEILSSFRQFVEWCYEEGHTDKLPRNLRSKSMSIPFRQHRKAKQVWTDDEIQTLLSKASQRTKLYILLALNCGYTQSDISTLEQTDIDWSTGRIARPRHKTGVDNNLSVKLWPATLDLLRKENSGTKHVLTNETGGLLVSQEVVERNGKRRLATLDNVRCAFARLVRKLKLEGKTFKHIKKSAVSKLASHPQYRSHVPAFLCHTYSVADEFYVVPSQEQYDLGIEWLGSQYGF